MPGVADERGAAPDAERGQPRPDGGECARADDDAVRARAEIDGDDHGSAVAEARAARGYQVRRETGRAESATLVAPDARRRRGGGSRVASRRD